MKNILSYETVSLDDSRNALVILDQTKLPGEIKVLSLTSQKDIWNAIYQLQVRGAPAIGVAAAIGIYLAAKEIKDDVFEIFYEKFRAAKEYLASSRPTAVNLFWALNRMEKIVLDNAEKPVCEICSRIGQRVYTGRYKSRRMCGSSFCCSVCALFIT